MHSTLLTFRQSTVINDSLSCNQMWASPEELLKIAVTDTVRCSLTEYQCCWIKSRTLYKNVQWKRNWGMDVFQFLWYFPILLL